LPVSVVQVPRDQEQRSALLDAQIHQVLTGATGRPADLLHRGALVGGQPAQGAVEVQIGGVDELHGALLSGQRRKRPAAATRAGWHAAARISALSAMRGPGRLKNTLPSTAKVRPSRVARSPRSVAAPKLPSSSSRVRCTSKPQGIPTTTSGSSCTICYESPVRKCPRSSSRNG